MGGTTLHAGILVQWFEMLLLLQSSSMEFDLVQCTLNASISKQIMFNSNIN